MIICIGKFAVETKNKIIHRVFYRFNSIFLQFSLTPGKMTERKDKLPL